MGKDKELMVTVEGADQDAALAAAEDLAKKEGYGRVSLKNIVKVTYKVMLFEPVEGFVKTGEPEPAE